MASRTPITDPGATSAAAGTRRGSAGAGGTGGADAAAGAGVAEARQPVRGLVVDRCLTPADRRAALARDVRAGLTAQPRELPPKWFYDMTGSMLFEKITQLPEYYPTRCEHAILTAHAAEIAAACPAATLIELGSGTSRKTRMLLDALLDAGTLRRFVAFDVDESTLVQSGQALLRRYPGLSVYAVVGDFEHHLDRLPYGPAPGGTQPGPAGDQDRDRRRGRDRAGGEGAAAERRLVALLGSTIGNLRPSARGKLLRTLCRQLRAGDGLLLGTDLVKDPDRLLAAYDDSAGMTAAFNRNMLSVINRELGADFNLRGFAHVAAWDPANHWVEMRLRSIRAQEVGVRALDLVARFDEDEEMRTEISAKFTLDGVAAELADAGLAVVDRWTDPDRDFALTLATPA